MKKLATLFILLMCGCIQPPDGNHTQPPPEPVKDAIEASAEEGWVKYHDRLPSAFESLAIRLRNGEFKSQKEFADEMDRVTKEARLSAFDAMREAWQDQNPEPWSPEDEAVRCEKTAVGLRRGK